MPEFKVKLPDGPLVISHYDGGLTLERHWIVKDGSVDVEDGDIEFFSKYVAEAELVDAGDSKQEEAPPVSKKVKADG